MSMRTLADILTTASKQQLQKIKQATSLSEGQLAHRNADLTAAWVKNEIAAALQVPVDQLFGPAINTRGAIGAQNGDGK